ncbi:MAG: hypothetical protein Q4Q06_04115 [Bacteroidota bacterium]|nr:hypothetical protein [Bacteroidota bacterium]
MKLKLNKIKIVLLCLSALAITTVVFIACSDEKEDINLSNDKKVLTDIQIPDGGFMFINKNSSLNTLSVSTGTSLSDFITERTIENGTTIDSKNIIYELEDLGTIRVIENKENNTFTFIAFDDEFQVFNIQDDIDGFVSYSVTHKDGDTVYGKVYYNGLNAETFAGILASNNTFDNPFLSSFKKTEASLESVVAVATLIVSVVKVVIDWFSKSCERKLHADEVNCNKMGKCIEYKSRCHYECVKCPTSN